MGRFTPTFDALDHHLDPVLHETERVVEINGPASVLELLSGTFQNYEKQNYRFWDC